MAKEAVPSEIRRAWKVFTCLKYNCLLRGQLFFPKENYFPKHFLKKIKNKKDLVQHLISELEANFMNLNDIYFLRKKNH